MISVEQAWQHLFQNLPEREEVELPLALSAGCFLSRDIHSAYDHPFFDNSAVDGYAIRFADLENGALKTEGKISAGASGTFLEQGTAARIFTGAALPAGADTVVMQEFVTAQNGYIRIHDAGLKAGGNVRRKGEQLKKNQLALTRGTRISAPLIGFLATIGIENVPVFRLPKVHMINTGDEFSEPGKELLAGKIFESNGAMLRAAFASLNISLTGEIAKDDAAGIAEAVKIASEKYDLLVMTGGVSVGEFDFTRAALEANGYSVIFHKVSQKPGKPLLFARKENQFAFGLPGNPRAVIMAFYLHILPWLEASMKCSRPGLKKVAMPLAEKYLKKGERAEFLACTSGAGKIHISPKQDSHMLSSFQDAFGIAWIPQSKSQMEAGDLVDVFILPA